jgi:ankyrin repeat protein
MNRNQGRNIGGDVHYLMEVPSPKFSSALGDDIGEDEEKNEIIRCILYNDHQALKENLSFSMLDITEIRDEMGYTLAHLAAYNNTEKCMEVLFQHILSSNGL